MATGGRSDAWNLSDEMVINMPMGRPTIYNDEILAKAREYVENFMPLPESPIPMICDLALHLKVNRDTIYDWASQPGKEEFSDIVEDLMAKQEKYLFAGGLTNKFNASITKLALTKHGYTDKTETKDLSNKALEDYTDEELDAFIADRA